MENLYHDVSTTAIENSLAKQKEDEAELLKKNEIFNSLGDNISKNGLKGLSLEEIKMVTDIMDIYLNDISEAEDKILFIIKAAISDFDTFKFLSLRAQSDQTKILDALNQNHNDIETLSDSFNAMSKAWATKERLNIISNL